MEGREKIKQLLKDGKINSDQATILLNSLKESDERRDRIFKQVVTQKEKREQCVKGYLGIWIAVFLCVLTSLLFIGNVGKLGRDVNKGLVLFHQANDLIAQENYDKAIVVIEKGIKKARRFPLGYTLLGSTYQLKYQQTKDEDLIKEVSGAFAKARELESVFERRHKMNSTAVLFTGILIVLIAGILSVIFLVIYNALVGSEERVNEAWARLRVYYDKKLNLIPALLEAIKEYSQYEKDVLVNVIQARSGVLEKLESIDMGALKDIKTDGLTKQQMDLNGALGKIFALSEKYPDIKANEHYLTIQHQIEEVEDDIVKARNHYNRKVKGYNAAIKAIPLNLVSSACKFESREYLELKTS